jgi:hypothetical protein
VFDATTTKVENFTLMVLRRNGSSLSYPAPSEINLRAQDGTRRESIGIEGPMSFTGWRFESSLRIRTTAWAAGERSGLRRYWRQPATNRLTTATYSAGCVMCGTCPAPGSVLTSAPSMASASCAMIFEKKGGL